MHMDLFGKFEELENDQQRDNDVYQLSEYSLLDNKNGSIYFTDDLGRIGSLLFTNCGRIMYDLVAHDQINTASDLIDLMINIEHDLPEN